MSDLKKTRDHVEPNAKRLSLLRCASEKQTHGLRWANVVLTRKRSTCVGQHRLQRCLSTWDQFSEWLRAGFFVKSAPKP